MTLETTSAFDVEIYEGLALLLDQFPGLLITRDILLARSSEGMEAKLRFEWVSFDKKSEKRK